MVNTGAALRKFWKDAFSVVEYQKVQKPNGSTGFEEVTVLQGLPCKLSFSTLQTANQNEDDAAIVQVTKLFCDNEIMIKTGSKIVVDRQNRTFEFSRSGESGVFSSHQEIVLVPFKGWA